MANDNPVETTALFPEVTSKYIVDNISTNVVLENVRGGQVYVFNQPLESLNIEHVEPSDQESEVMFEPAAVGHKDPTQINLWVEQERADMETYTFVPSSKCIELPSTGSRNRYGFVPDNYVLSEIPEIYDIRNARRCILSGGSIMCTSSYSGWVVSARGVKQILQSGEYDQSGKIIYKTYASSTKTGNIAVGDDPDIWKCNWTAGGVMFTWFAGDGGALETKTGSGGACVIDPIGDAITGPVTIPNSTLLLNSSTFEPKAEQKYLLKFRGGMMETFTVNSQE